ncbi:MAG: N-acetyl sugar amidotransferase [Deltaproteobacteria bacterium]|nr:N-acetyl sugar amidotransferase [Deltaproteobacteria bacterium]
MSDLVRCKRCHLPETYETIEFDSDGICNICRSTEKKQQIDWAERKKLLDTLVEKYRGKAEYDCIVPFSGGKDSTFQLWYLMTQYKLKPLVVRFNHGFMRPKHLQNSQRTLKRMGADVLEFTPNWHIVKRLMLESFCRKTDFCWHCHTGIYSYPLRVALRYGVPLIFWGEPLAEISHYYNYLDDTVEYEDETKFNMCRNLGITATDMQSMISTQDDPVDPRDLIPFTYPPLADLKKLNYCSVCLGSFIPWDYTKNTEIIRRELGWEPDELEGVPDELNPHGEKIECFMQGARDYIKFMKRGYSRITQISAFNIRNGRMRSEDALPYITEEGKRPPSLDVLLGYLGLTEDEFNQIVKSTEVFPYSHDLSKTRHAAEAADANQWYREPMEQNRARALTRLRVLP